MFKHADNNKKYLCGVYMAKRIGERTVVLEKRVAFVGYGSVVGKHEHQGPLGYEFDSFDMDCRFGEESYEKAESTLQKIALQTALKKSGYNETEIDCVFAGDLLNQCIGSFYGLKQTEIPLVGLYGACSTMTLALIMASNLIESGAANRTAAVTSSHFCSAERQYRFPLEYGSQRTPTAQRTVTGSGASILEESEKGPYISAFTIGKIVDLGVTDANNMGAAMAP